MEEEKDRTQLYVGYKVQLHHTEEAHILYLYEDPIFFFLKSIVGVMASRRLLQTFHEAYEYAAWSQSRLFASMSGLEVMLSTQVFSKYYNGKQLKVIESIVGPSWYLLLQLQQADSPVHSHFTFGYYDKHPEPWTVKRT